VSILSRLLTGFKAQPALIQAAELSGASGAVVLALASLAGAGSLPPKAIDHPLWGVLFWFVIGAAGLVFVWGVLWFLLLLANFALSFTGRSIRFVRARAGTLPRIRIIVERRHSADSPADAVASRPQVDAAAETARGGAKAFDPTIKITDALQAQITRGPSNPGIDEVNWRTEGLRGRHVHLDRKPRALRIFHPVDQLITKVPAEFPVGQGRVIVTRFFDGGFMVDEIGTVGDVVRAQPYFEASA
jgi:hypothetical protein